MGRPREIYAVNTDKSSFLILRRKCGKLKCSTLCVLRKNKKLVLTTGSDGQLGKKKKLEKKNFLT